MNVKVFVDTNVLVYARDASEPLKQPQAADWLRRLWIERAGRTSVQVLNEYYVTVTRKLSPGLDKDEAWRDVRSLFAWNPQPIDPEVQVRAREIESRFNLSWWDSMIVAAAHMQGCDLLLSEDLQDGLDCEGLIVRSPFEDGVAEPAAPYEASTPPAQPVSRHRPRGRPARRIRV